MALTPPKKFIIGQRGWQEQIRQITDEISRDYWNGFVTVSETEIISLEQNLNRKLPSDLRDFLYSFGYGPFTEYGGNTYSPDEMILACPGPIWMQLGSSEWASDEDHRQFYISRGRENPDPRRFTTAAINQLGFSLLDLLQIGTDGSCGYLTVFVGDRSNHFGYCVLHGTEVENQLATFSDGLFSIMSRHWRWRHGIEDD